MDFITIYLNYSTFFDKMTIINRCKHGIENNRYTSISAVASHLMDNTSVEFSLPRL